MTVKTSKQTKFRRMRVLSLVLALCVMIGTSASPKAQGTMYDDWEYVHQFDEFEQVDVSFVFTMVTTDGRNAALAVGCFGPAVQVLYTFGKLFAGDGRSSTNSASSVWVRYRFDQGQATETLKGSLGSDRKTLKLPEEHEEAFISGARTSMKAYLEVRDPADRERLTDIFSLKGFGRAAIHLKCLAQ